jgi:hypothetical protein
MEEEENGAPWQMYFSPPAVPCGGRTRVSASLDGREEGKERACERGGKSDGGCWCRTPMSTGLMVFWPEGRKRSRMMIFP